MESSVVNLEQSVMKADSRLDKITWRLDLFEKDVADAVLKNGDEDSVVNLLQSVSQVKEEYEHLRQELSEVQELQKVIRDSVRFKSIQVQQRMIALRTKINSSQFQLNNTRH